MARDLSSETGWAIINNDDSKGNTTSYPGGTLRAVEFEATHVGLTVIETGYTAMPLTHYSQIKIEGVTAINQQEVLDYIYANFKKRNTGGGTPVTQLNAPTNFDGTAGEESASLSWDSVTNATSYQIQRSTASNFSGAVSTTDTASPATITGLTGGTPYYFRIRAKASGYASSEWVTLPSNVAITPEAAEEPAGGALFINGQGVLINGQSLFINAA